MNRSRTLLFIAGLLIMVVLDAASAFSASNSVPPSNIREITVAKDPNQFKPFECSSIPNITAIVDGRISDGTGGSDLILGGPGNDTLNGKQGSDCIVAGAGDDNLDGKSGNNILLGGPGNDSLDGGGAGYNICYGGGSTIPGGDTYKRCSEIH